MPARLVISAVLGALLGVYTVHTLTGVGGATFGLWLYTFLMFAAAALCLLRARRPDSERRAWLLMGAGLVLFAAGDTYWSLFLADLDEAPYPSIADIGWIIWYPLAGASLFLLIRSRFPSAGRLQWLDGAIAGLGCAAVGGVVVAATLVESSIGDSLAATLTNLAYPVGDLVLIALCVCGLAVTGWRPGRAWLLMCVAIAVGAVADAWYLWGVLHETYAEGDFVNVLWPASTLLIAAAVWVPPSVRRPYAGRRVLTVSMAVAVSAVGLLVYGQIVDLHPLVFGLAAATLLAVVARTWLTFGDYVSLLRVTQEAAHTDALTELANRRLLVADLDAAIAHRDGHGRALAMIDLNGFKRFNDNFGHAGGDALLIRLAARLVGAVGPAGSVYRMGGDEFCVLLRCEPDELVGWLDMLRGAAAESRAGYTVDGACGGVLLGVEARTADEALRLADARMYHDKSTTAPGRRRTDEPYALA